ncbi:MAG: hypothetical protein QNK37_38205 [Acidobacteriota bacterium]|nr:hypothetical protein [Acidobacteriota bacterium]
MSLKHFHIFFMFICIFLLVGFGAWGIATGRQPDAESWRVTMGVVLSVLGVALIGYLVHFLKKIKKEGWES